MELQGWFGGMLVFAAFVVALFLGLRALGRAADRKATQVKRAMDERMEALFRAGFPELQPHFHPKNVYEYAKARQARKASSGPTRWRNPPGFPLATTADIEPDGLKDKVRLLDAKDAVLATFAFEEHAEGAALRVGKGKLTVGLKGPEPRVRYWHPEREFKWTPTSWKLKSGLADQSLESSRSRDPSSSDSDSSSYSSPSTTAAATAAGAGIVAAGGSFDGGGASAAWDDGGSSDSSSGSSDFSDVESGSSSTSSSTTY